MTDPVASAELAVRERQELARPGDVLPSDDEIRRMYRIAEALFASRAFTLQNAESAFAKMIVGRDLGLSPAQAMAGVHLVEGGVQMHYSTLGQFVRSRDGYDYRAGWIKAEPLADAIAREDREPTQQEAERVVNGEVVPVFVWFDEEDPLDDREVTGAAVVFTVDDTPRGTSRFTVDDARKAQLIKDDKPRAAWNTSRRNMLLARAMSNGVKWFVPEVMNGLPVYAMGELEQAREGTDLTAPTGDGDDAGQGVDLGPKVEKVIERATELGHRGLSNRAALELALGQRAPGVVNRWVAEANKELDRFAAEKAAATSASEGVDGGSPEVAEQDVPDEVTAEPVAEPSRDPRAHIGHRVVLARTEGEEDRLRCEDCDLVLDSTVADGGPEDAAEAPEADAPAQDPHAAIADVVEADGGEVENA